MRKVFILMGLLLMQWSVQAQEVFLVKKSLVKFTSDAPLEMIEAQSTKMEGAIKTDDRSFVFRSPMNTFDGFNSALQKTHFNTNYLETARHPYTIFEGKIIEEIDFSKPGAYMVRGKGVFTCHGIEQERIIKCKLLISEKSIQITSDFTVLLDDHNIKIPSVVNQKIAEEIVISLNLELAPNN
ncbi:MAG: YceI family protein [Salinivirgaceae bacterium]